MDNELEVLYGELSLKRDAGEDCTETIQKIVNQFEDSPVFIPEGTYKVNGVIVNG